MYRKESPATIQSMFNNIAKRYDLTNGILSLMLHKYWNRALVRRVQQKHSPHTLLDLCSGTGDIAFDYLKKLSLPCQAYFIDFSSEMLAHAEKKEKRLNISPIHQLSYIEADVQYLPLPNEIADCATMAYGMRNVKDPVLCIQEVSRVLKPGGCFGILELTRPKHPLLRLGHQIYLKTFLPLFGKWLTENELAYQYLNQSIQSFAAPEELQNHLIRNGFSKTEIVRLSGGVATIILGYKNG